MEPTWTDQRAQEEKQVFADIIRRGALPKEASIHTAEMTAIKIIMREMQKREYMRYVI